MKRQILLGFFLVILLASVFFANQSLNEGYKKANIAILIPPPKDIKKFTLGYDDAFSDALWLRFLQDSGTCDQQLSPDTTRVGLNRKHNCKEGWGYQMISSIVELAPRNKTAYVAGSVLLSIVIDDIDGAKKIYDLAVSRFPYDKEIRFNAGSFYLTEVGDKEKAADNFKAAVNLGAPAWVGALAARLYSEGGRLLVAKRMLEVFLERHKGVKFQDRVEERLKEINKKISELPREN